MKEIKEHIKRKTKIYSLEHGSGEIVGILKYYDGIQDYIEVKFDKNTGGVNLYPLNFKSELRIISDPLEITVILKKLSSKIVNIDYIHRTRFHQRIDADADLEFLINTIASLVGNLNLKSLDKKLLSRCVESLILEVSHVYKIDKSIAKGIVSDYMRAA